MAAFCGPTMALNRALRLAYPEAIRIASTQAPHGHRILVISWEFLTLCPQEREQDLTRRLAALPAWQWLGQDRQVRIAVTFLATPDEEWSGEWPFLNRHRFLDPKALWHGAA
jgi:hypothetical protein